MSPIPHVPTPRPTAVVYCEANFGATDGKTANGLVRHSERYEILVGHRQRPGRPRRRRWCWATSPTASRSAPTWPTRSPAAGARPDCFIFGVAPSSGMLSAVERQLVLDAMAAGHEHGQRPPRVPERRPRVRRRRRAHGVTILDVRRPRDKKDLRMFSGRIGKVDCPRIAVLGTDSAIGKRTTATILTKALNDRGHPRRAGRHRPDRPDPGRPLRRRPGRHPLPVLLRRDGDRGGRGLRGRAPRRDRHRGPGRAQPPRVPDVDVHPARAASPQAVILQHAPAGSGSATSPTCRCPRPAVEINLIETFADTRVIGLTINHENMTDAEVTAAIAGYEVELGIPATDALTRPPDRLVDMVVQAFPQLEQEACRPRARRPAAGDPPRPRSTTTPGAGRSTGAPRASASPASPRRRWASPEIARELLAAGVTGARRLADREHRGDCAGPAWRRP